MLDLTPIYLTLKLAVITTLFLFFLGVPLAFWLSETKSKTKYFFETLISMPLVLPPTVIGFYLLVTFSSQSFIGSFLEKFIGLQLIFTFEGLVFASIIYSLPFMVHPLLSGLKNLPKNISESSYLMGKSKFTTLIKVLLPNIKPSILTGLVLSFAHTVGEFGVVLMIGGNIPEQTRVASIAIYNEVESLNYETAHIYSLILFVITFLILFMVNVINKGYLSKLR